MQNQKPTLVLQVKGDHNNSTLDRFPCDVCGKSYLRKRHLQRHMRDECIGIPPRFSCELCSSRFRRKYHMVRHLTSKHNIPHDIAQQATGGGTRHAANNSNNNNNSIQNGSIDLNVFNLKMESNKKSNSDVKNGGAENLTLRKDLFGGCGQNETDNQKNGENMSTSPAHSGGAYSSSGTHSPMAGHFLMPFCGLSGAITAIPANAGAGLDYDKPIYANVKVKDTINVKAEPLSPTKVENLALSVTTDPTDADNQVDEDWKLKLSMQLISNSLLKERLINNLTFSAGYNSNN